MLARATNPHKIFDKEISYILAFGLDKKQEWVYTGRELGIDLIFSENKDKKMYEKEYTNREEMIEELIKIRDTHVRPRDVLVSVGFARYGARINDYYAIHINSMISEIFHLEKTMVPKEKQYKGTIFYYTA